ncbi:hypothetical protein LTR53_016822 [Teratosphaeriaceae sp. CCFEE 6253]|nr:hypothetical protein LTR53_016822 [Teratosphaeriaceae sp. CCFEE 6253]
MPRPPPPGPDRSTEALYDGSAYGEPDFVEQNDSWPLPAAPSRPYVEQGRINSPQSRSPSGQRRPPQRPQRPDHDETVLDPPRQARIAPANQQYRQPPPPPPPPPPPHHGSGQWTGDGYSSPSSAYPPQLQQAVYQQGSYGQANKRPPLGPPPSARRGPASYYPQIAPVHPIAEETDSMCGSIRHGSSIYPNHDSMKSYASSNAIPIGIPDYYLEQRDSMPSLPGAERPQSQDDYAPEESPVDAYAPVSDDGRDSSLAEHEGDYNSRDASPEPAALIRQASFGRKSKPTLTTVKSGERMRKLSSGDGLGTLPSQQTAVPRMPVLAKEASMAKETGGTMYSDSEKDSFEEPREVQRSGFSEKELEAGGAAALTAVAVAAPLYTKTNKSRDDLSQRTHSSDLLGSGTGLLDPSSSESEKSQRKVKPKTSKELLGIAASKPAKHVSRERSPLAQEVDPRMSDIITGLQKGGALSPSESEKLKAPKGGLSERAGKRRPPRLDVDAVRDAEARGSLTSLPDLIKRATRLASNLDRGKTASRLGMTWFDGVEGNGDEKRRSYNTNSDKRRSGSINDMLASFPPPGIATPPGSRGGGLPGEGGRSLTNWSSNLRHSHLPSDSDADEQARSRRRRRCCGMPLWLFLLLLVLLVLLIAAAIIVPVVLVVVPKQSHNGAGSAADRCPSTTSCLNGGANVLTTAGTCQCICVNGYTGVSCGTASGAGCTTTAIGSTSDATVGDAIPRLLAGAQGNFSVPLDGQSLLGLFSGADMSCQTENALVTFDNNAGARRGLEDVVALWAPTPTVRKRQTATGSGGDGAATSNGIVFQTGSPAPSSSTSSASPSATSSSSSSSSGSSTSSSASSSDATTTDFARVAVLYIFQASGQLDAAIAAQDSLRDYFRNGRTSTGQDIDPANVTLGNGYSADLGGRSLSLANGTAVGGGG